MIVCTLHHPPAHALMVLQLADDLDVLALLTQHFPDSMNVSGLTDERGEDHVNTLFHAKLQVLNVLLRHCRQVNSSSGQVDALLAAQRAAVLNVTNQVIAAFGYKEAQNKYFSYWRQNERRTDKLFVLLPTSLTLREIRPSST